ncbi:hypothetical protein FACS1894216_15330 [Synergistales bacterium]|nr:hypothetical protein FACS1894216_15330 [Synergistales bacterium]
MSYSALSIPPWNRKAVQIVEGLYEYLEDMTKDKILKHLANKAAASIPIEQLLEAYEIIKARKTEDTPRSEADIYFDEYKVLGKGDLQSEDEYSAFTAEIPPGFERYFDKITVVDKLTVVQALKGFTRLKPWNGNSSAVAPLSSTQKEWLPAVKLNGEGVFFKFNEEILLSWAERAGQRYEEMETALENSFYKDANPRFSPRYVLLHTFAHLLIRQLANECGYSASSIREKIYSSFKGERNQMYGVLIYLASSDADGSLGGLISIAEDPERLRGILENMLHKAQWCSADPLCITSKNQGFLSLNYAACHDCVLLPETSCESGNILLDRVSVVGTPDDLSAGLFGDYLSRE